MSSAIALERGLNFEINGRSAAESDETPDLLYPIGDNRNPAELEFWHIQEILAGQDSLKTIAKRAWSQEGNVLDLLQTGIIGLVASEYSPLVLVGEALQLGYLKLKTLEKGLSLDEAAELPISETSPDLYKGLSWLLTAATAASLLPVPVNLLANGGKIAKTTVSEQSGSSDGRGQGPDFNNILKWVLPIGGGITLGYLISACAKAFGLPEPAVKVATNTPDTRLTPTPTEKPGATHTPAFEASPTVLALTPGGGGPEFRPGSAADLQSLIDRDSLQPAICVDVDSIQYAEIRTNLQAQGANIDSLKIALENNLKVGQSLKLLCQQEGWVFVAVDGKGNILWSWDLSRNKWADHMDAVLSSGWEFRPVEARPGYQSEVVILGGQPWLIEFKDGTPARYFDTLTGEFRDFRWGALSGTDRLITQFDWTGINGTRILPDGSLEVSGFTGVDGGLALNPNIQMVDITGDFSFGAKFTVEAGVGGGLAFMDRDPRGLANWWESRQLHVIVGRESNGQNGLWIGYLDFSQEPETLRFENSIPPQIDGQDVVEIKFRPGTDGITVVINGRELDTVIAKGLLENAKLSLGVSTSQNAKNTVSEFFVNVPVGGQDNVRLQGMLPEATAAPEPASTTAATPKPRPTAIPVTTGFTSVPTLEPSATAEISPNMTASSGSKVLRLMGLLY